MKMDVVGGDDTDNACIGAAENDHLDCLEYASNNGCSCNPATCAGAATYGHLDCLIYAHENGEWDYNTCIAAKKNGHLDCLKICKR
jgi:hypothetical protein